MTPQVKFLDAEKPEGQAFKARLESGDIPLVVNFNPLHVVYGLDTEGNLCAWDDSEAYAIWVEQERFWDYGEL